MKKALAIITAAILLSGCATSLVVDRQGIRYSTTPPEDAGLTWRVIAIEASKIAGAAAGAYLGSK